MWVRGLKQKHEHVLNRTYQVAPYVGAWIETYTANNILTFYKSHPMWVRGLKQSVENAQKLAKEVAPYVGAWIETRPYKHH